MTTLNDLNGILNSIPEVKPDSFNKLQLEDIQLIHPSLTLDCPLTYIIYLVKRPDLSKDERNTIYKIIKKLNYNNDVIGQSGYERLKDRSSYN